MRKPDLFVLARFLDALHGRPGGLSRSALQRATRVNYDIFRAYLDLLDGRGLAASDDQGNVALTPAGAAARERLLDWIEDVLGGLPR